MIQFANVEFSYPHSNLQLEIPKFHLKTGQRAVVIGPSGCGKTTFLNLVAGILKPLKGQVIVSQVELQKLKDQATRNFRISNIGFIFQNFELIEYLTVEHNILFPFYINHSLKLTPAVKQEMLKLMQQIKIEKKLHCYPHQLSQGEKQRVCIARALITNAPLILADEPTGNLDPNSTQTAMNTIESICQERGTTFLMVTHDYSLLDRFDCVIKAEDWSLIR